MKQGIRITIASLVLVLAAACGGKKHEQPRPSSGGRTCVPAGK